MFSLHMAFTQALSLLGIKLYQSFSYGDTIKGASFILLVTCSVMLLYLENMQI